MRSSRVSSIWLATVRMWPSPETRMPVPYDGIPRKPPAPKILTSLLLTFSAMSANDSSARTAEPRVRSSARASSFFMGVGSPRDLSFREPINQRSFHVKSRQVDESEAVLAVAHLDLLRQAAALGILL